MTTGKNYDLAIIGSGPGGYVAALYGSHKGLSVCVIEKDILGGTCLNRGCIPTKTLINSTQILSTIKNSSTYGIDVSAYSMDFRKMVSRKDEVVSRLRAGIETLFRANKIDLVNGTACLVSANSVEVQGHGKIEAKNIMIAAGSKVAGIPAVKIDEKEILSSDGILNLTKLPASLVIIGGGVIGCEFASLFRALGVKVTIIEVLDRLIAPQSKEASKKLELAFKKNGIDIHASSKVESVTKSKAIDVALAGGKVISAEKVLVSVGRRPDTEGLGLERAGIKIDCGRIQVDSHLRTSLKNVYAVGDCVSGPQLAHKASYDGILACDNILGGSRAADYSNIPNCIWTDPEIASVGPSEEEAKAACPDLKMAKFPYLGSGKAYLIGKPEGYVKIMGDAKGSILGVEIFGASACELIAEAVLAKTAGVNIKDWARVVHGHPTLSEILQEAAHVFCGTAIHTPS